MSDDAPGSSEEELSDYSDDSCHNDLETMIVMMKLMIIMSLNQLKREVGYSCQILSVMCTWTHCGMGGLAACWRLVPKQLNITSSSSSFNLT